MAKGRRIPQVLTEQERTALLRAPNPRYPTGERNRLLMSVMLNAGLRVSEATALQWRHVDLNTGRLHVVEGKGSKDRVLWLGEGDLEGLRSWRQRQTQEVGHAPDHVFSTLEGGPLQRRYVHSMVSRYAGKAGITWNVHPHSLRHTFATDLLRQVGNVELVRKALGHSHLSTTQIYTHLVDADLEGALKSFRTAEAVAV